METVLLHTSTWPHLRCDVGLEEGEYREKLFLCYSSVHYCNGAQRYKQFLQAGRLDQAFDLAWFSSLSSEHFCVFGLHGAICIFKFFCLHPSLYLLVS